MHVRHGCRVALAGLLAGVLLAGCDGGGSDPSSSSTAASTSGSTTSTSSTSSSSSPSSSPSGSAYVPLKPEFPAAAKKQTLQSAEAFVIYFYELVNYAYAKPEAGLLGPLGTAGCEVCKGYEKIAADLVAKNQHYDGPMVQTERVTFSTEDLSAPWIIYNGRQPGSRIVNERGDSVYVSKAVKLHIRLVLAWTGQGWRIQELSNT
ncbi:MAG: DUF6318 family protein [Dermatophilaceae bacterium]